MALQYKNIYEKTKRALKKINDPSLYSRYLVFLSRYNNHTSIFDMIENDKLSRDKILSYNIDILLLLDVDKIDDIRKLLDNLIYNKGNDEKYGKNC